MRNNQSTTHVRRGNRHFGRYRQIAQVLLKYRLNELLNSLGLQRYLPIRLPSIAWRKMAYSNSQRTRMALEELGTTFIKMGQILSTRTDIFPEDFTNELSNLQSSLTPISLESVEAVIQGEFNKPVGELFSYFDPNPLGVASIGQVHAAKLSDGTEVVVKVLKPGVVEQVTEDLEILRQLAGTVSRKGSYTTYYNLVNLVEEISDTLNSELDYIREGHSAEHFARFFKDYPSIHIPKVFWEYTTSKVITLERIKGVGILNINELDKAGLDRHELAKRAIDIWVKMVFEGTVFHADPHPGNLLVEPNGRLGLLDFGMIGVIDDEVRNHLTGAVKGILDRDVDMLVDSLIELGAITPAGTRLKLRKDLKHLMEHYPLASEGLRLSSNLSDLFNVVRDNHVQLPANTFLLLKTMAMVQALGRGLDSKYDFFEELSPRVQEYLNSKYRPSALVRRLPKAILQLAMFGVGLPGRLSRIIQSIERGEFQMRADVFGLELHLEHLERIVNRIIIGIVIAALMISVAIGILAFKL